MKRRKYRRKFPYTISKYFIDNAVLLLYNGPLLLCDMLRVQSVYTLDTLENRVYIQRALLNRRHSTAAVSQSDVMCVDK